MDILSGQDPGYEGLRRAPWESFDGARYSRSLAIGVAMVADCFESGQCLGIVDLAGLMSLSRATTHRYAATLRALGWLEQTDERKYRLAHRSAWPGMSALGEIALATDCEPLLHDLRAQTGHTATLGVLDGSRVTYVRRLSAHGRGQYPADGGLRAGAHVPWRACLRSPVCYVVCLSRDVRARLAGVLTQPGVGCLRSSAIIRTIYS